ncbi:MAG: PHP domain-containing protein [Anaerolineaceae bacterium]|nr:PHP domain-containing protein [Anaerolineaceae bacterium]
MSSGLHFCNVDLHVHTPKSECFIEPDVSPAMIVSEALHAGMKAIAITDHNSADWVDLIKEAAIGTGLTVFPGVEITVQPGVHVLAIFPEDRATTNVNDLLSDLGLRADDRGKNDSLVKDFSIQKTVSFIRNHNALPILAHIDDEKGAWKVLCGSGQTFIQFWETGEFAAVEIVGDRLPDGVGKDPYNRLPAFFWSSDNPHPENPTKHSHKGIGKRHSQFKLSEPITFEGLRLCFQDPSTRIRPAAPQPITHPVIERVSIDGGFLNEFDIELNPNLNCFIGGRGTGKSCLFEVVRHTFGINPKTSQNQTQAQDIIDNTFPAGSTASVQIRFDADTAYRVERTAKATPKVYRLGEDEPLGLEPADLLPIQVYGQKEVYEISRDSTFQLRLLDNYLEETLRPLKKDESEILNRLTENANQIQIRAQEIESIQIEVEKLGAVTEQLHRMERENFTTRLRQKSYFDREKELLDFAAKKIGDLTAALSLFLAKNSIETDRFDPNKIDGLPNKALLEQRKAALEEIDRTLENRISQVIAEIKGIDQRDGPGLGQWTKDYSEQEEAYQALLLEFQTDETGLKPERYIQLQREQRRLQGLSDTLVDLSNQLDEVKITRMSLLQQLKSNRRAQYELRQMKAEELSQKLGQRVRITIWPQGNRAEYQKQLGLILEGTRTRKDVIDQIGKIKAEHPERPAQRPINYRGETRYLIPEIPLFLDPIDLADAIRKEAQGVPEEESVLIQTYGIESAAMRRNLSGLSTEKLFELELVSIPDLPIIELKVGNGALGYKQLDSLSIGQKCTALLSLVLLESPAPLLIDQPEDDLDNHFIFDQIVTTLRSAKEKRQFLIATHNANIPVSGDAELIVVLNADERRGWIEEDGIGSIDTKSIKQYVEHILEGGENAFKIRKEKYGI